VADGVVCSILTSPAHLRRVRGLTRAVPALPVLAYLPVVTSADGTSARERLRPLLAHYLGVLHGQSILTDAGLGADRTQPFRDALLARRKAGALVTDAMIDALAIAGTPEECRVALTRFAEAGLDAPVAILAPGLPVTEQLAALGDTLVPAWRALTATPLDMGAPQLEDPQPPWRTA
jgi:hypothetical protein